jgi:LAS superfamily LD-carboxypeptidase LdcB
MNKKYMLTSKKLGDIQVVFTFGATGLLIGVELNDEPSPEATDDEEAKRIIKHFWTNAPVNSDDLLHRAKVHGIKITEIPTDLSFEAFWNKYNYKDGGSKKKTKEKYDKLSATDKAAAITYINIYNSSLARQMVAKAHALTYLNGARWENQ